MPSTRPQAKPTESMIWTRLIQPGNGSLPRDAARALLSLTFGDKDKKRRRELAERNNEGSLSDAERAELARRWGRFTKPFGVYKLVA